MMDILQLAGSLGVGAFLGLIIFLMYRADRHNSENKLREDRKFMEDRLDKIISSYNSTITKNSEILTELVTLLRRMNGRLSQ